MLDQRIAVGVRVTKAEAAVAGRRNDYAGARRASERCSDMGVDRPDVSGQRVGRARVLTKARTTDVIAILALLTRPFEASGATPFREELESAVATVSRQLADT